MDKEQRKATRFPARWRVAIFPNAEENYYLCETFALSQNGAGLFCDHCFLEGTIVRAVLEVPPLGKKEGNSELEVQGRITHSTLHGEHGFQVGLQFKQFESDGKELLIKALEKRFRSM